MKSNKERFFEALGSIKFGERFELCFSSGEKFICELKDEGKRVTFQNVESGRTIGRFNSELFDTMEIKKIPFQPNMGARCYYPNFTYISKYDYITWMGAKSDRQIQKAVGVYRTKEEAIAKAKELWNIE